MNLPNYPPPENKFHYRHYEKMAKYVRDVTREARGCVPGDKDRDLSDEVLEGILGTLYGFRVWLDSPEGSAWLFRLNGIEEAQPHVGYHYYIVEAQENRPVIRRALDRVTGDFLDLTIYNVNAVDKSREIPKDMYAAIRKTQFSMNWPRVGFDFMKFWVEHARNFLESIEGFRWCSEQIDYSNPLQAFGAINRYGERAYKIRDRNGKVSWAGHKIEGMQQSAWVEYEARSPEICDMCGQQFPCIQPTSALGRLCCHCAAQMSAESAVILDMCAYKECTGCQNHMQLSVVRLTQDKWRNSLDIIAR